MPRFRESARRRLDRQRQQPCQQEPIRQRRAYCASKSALNAFSEALMQEVRYDGIRVAYVLPGSGEYRVRRTVQHEIRVGAAAR